MNTIQYENSRKQSLIGPTKYFNLLEITFDYYERCNKGFLLKHYFDVN